MLPVITTSVRCLIDGSLKEISFFFQGIGAINNIELKDAKGDLMFADAFL
jgi:hypothetical protein